jgi:hypothetical protein
MKWTVLWGVVIGAAAGRPPTRPVALYCSNATLSDLAALDPGCLGEGSPGAIRRPLAFMPDPPAEPTRASRRRSPIRGARRVVRIDSTPAVTASVDPVKCQGRTDASTARSGRGKRLGSGDPAERPSPLVSPSQLGLRRPLMTLMPPDLREQAISALAHLLIAQFEREAQRRDPDTEDRGRVAGNGLRQEGQP